ncbi:MAG: septal ring lytic transglycosylase RlpA family protein [bacterium]
MTEIREINKIFLLSGLILFLTGCSCTAMADVLAENPEQKQEISLEVQSVQLEEACIEADLPKIYYKNFKEKDSVVYIKDKEIVRYNQTAGGFSPEDRAKILVARLEKFVSQGGNPKNITIGKENNTIVGRAGNLVLITADAKTAKSLGISESKLALEWVNNIREALGSPKIVRDYSLIASRSSVSAAFARNIGKEEIGIASWYGGKFHGRRAANGSIFNKHEFTAAHKTFPFGALVKVTNLKNNKSCVVKITDRGPFVCGRVIDLSRAAAKEIGILSSGTSRVKLEIIGKY